VVAAVVLAVAGAVSGCAPDNPPSSASLITLGDQGTAAVTLTFDCGSDLGSTTQILDLLRREGITAAFGATGRFAELYPAAVRRMIADGHQLINHSYDHPAFTTLSTAQRNQQLDRTEQIFTALGGTSVGWFRPPYFDRNAAVDTDLAAHGYYLELLASIDTLGWRVTPRKTTRQEVVTKPTCIRKIASGRSLPSTVGRPRSRRVDFRATGLEVILLHWRVVASELGGHGARCRTA
jgi:peptidoglycan/xylan/chitin deacetylase (PgdA/CDA1 family)